MRRLGECVVLILALAVAVVLLATAIDACRNPDTIDWH